MRFAELTIFIALTGGLLNVFYIGKAYQSPQLATPLKAAGVLATLLFYSLHERTMAWWRTFLKRAIELEKDMGFHQYTGAPHVRLLTSTNVVRAFYLVILLYWIVSFFWSP